MTSGKERFNDIIRFIMLFFPLLGPVAVWWQLRGYDDKWLHVFISVIIYVAIGAAQSWWAVALLILHCGGIILTRDEKTEREITQERLIEARLRALTEKDKDNG